MRNAALSVRNLKRSFRVMERLGVDPNLGASNVIIDQVGGSLFNFVRAQHMMVGLSPGGCEFEISSYLL